MSGKKRLRLGVVGLAFGEQHVRTLALMDRVELVGVADHDEGRSRSLASQYHCPSFQDALALMNTQKPDALTVCVSPRSRAPILKAAAERGIALFIEKPWASSARHGEELAAICRANPAPVMAGFSFRFHRAVQRAIQLVRGELGPVQVGTGSYVFEWMPPADFWLWDPRNGGGVFNENSCHLFDVICALAGRPREIFARGIKNPTLPSEVAAVVTLTFASGGTAALSLGCLGVRAQNEYPRLELFTEKGWLTLSGAHHTWQKVSWARQGEETRSVFKDDPEQLGRTRYTLALEHFIDCVETGKKPDATVEDGLLMVRIADGVKASLASGKPVEIPVEPEP